ncbi:ABC transporter permease [Ilumatobacter nonamiensis]|uniref:ABC transporter permease n=1 Tax=Ilumatobacter nonamiensis TaxID=467093 RepID=UPI000346EF16|nr:ABC transporter permease subunit [Ilumatobacter nonamiensis]
MRLRHLARSLWPPALFGVAFLVLWEAVVAIFSIAPFTLPAPSAIWTAFVDRFDQVADETWVTGFNAFVGLLLGVVFGVLASLITVRFIQVEALLTPLAVAVNAIPIVVIVPILNNMLFGTTSQVPRRLMVMLIVFFVVFVNVSKGLRQVSATHLELMRSYAASPTEIMRKVRVPNATGYLFTALKIAAPLAVITAFVAEYFGGVQSGLATGVRNSLNGSKDVTWAYVIGASALGLTFYLISSGLERLQRGRHPAD